MSHTKDKNVKVTVHHSHGEEDTKHEEDQNGKVIASQEDIQLVANNKSLSQKLKDAQELVRNIKTQRSDNYVKLSKSEYLKQAIENKETEIDNQEKTLANALATYQTEKDVMASLVVEYQELTGIERKIKSNGKKKFDFKVIQDKDDQEIWAIHITYKEELFEYMLINKNGQFSNKDWLVLSKLVTKDLVAKYKELTITGNLPIRSMLSHLKPEIEKKSSLSIV